MKKNKVFPFVTRSLLVSASLVLPLSTSAALVMTNQGTDWTDATRQTYYSQDQGSRIMPLKWMQALKQANGKPFMARSLSRYGYLPNPKSKVANVPVGFTVAAEKNGEQSIGMTCSACHTRQIDVSGTSYRIDGGPALSDMQGFMADLDHAVNTILNDTTAFTEFATSVLGHTPTQLEQDVLRTEVNDWFLPYHTLVDRALPTQSPWGVGRFRCRLDDF
ncbi:di-heme-cytochrome C peroxidase [Methylocucumis oryzae]|uniref:di-heme-cytochrome C peroxidase n=1 Tax=Methylocucumis oryzae TaxID=1632867 RepID=UPI000A54043B|nr:di-heme-cytochrome C peroxidase [Methylocucumis oryzae]